MGTPLSVEDSRTCRPTGTRWPPACLVDAVNLVHDGVENGENAGLVGSLFTKAFDVHNGWTVDVEQAERDPACRWGFVTYANELQERASARGLGVGMGRMEWGWAGVEVG